MGSQHQALLEAMVRLVELNFNFVLSLITKLRHLDKILIRFPCIFVVSVTLSCYCHSYQSSPLFITL